MSEVENKEMNDSCKCEGSCKCWGHCHGMHGCCHGGKYHLVRMILKMIIVILIFWAGFQIGQMTGYLRAGEGRMMRGGGYLYQTTSALTPQGTFQSAPMIPATQGTK